MKFKFLEHTADIKFQAFGNSVEEVFENSALAMFSAMHEGKVKETKKKMIEVKGDDLENLLYNFLEELLFLFDSEGFFLGKVDDLKISKDTVSKKQSGREKKNKFKTKEGGLKLNTEVIGDKAENYSFNIDVKAVTYNEMFVKFDDKKKKWTAQVVIDV